MVRERTRLRVSAGGTDSSFNDWRWRLTSAAAQFCCGARLRNQHAKPHALSKRMVDASRTAIPHWCSRARPRFRSKAVVVYFQQIDCVYLTTYFELRRSSCERGLLRQTRSARTLASGARSRDRRPAAGLCARDPPGCFRSCCRVRKACRRPTAPENTLERASTLLCPGFSFASSTRAHGVRRGSPRGRRWCLLRHDRRFGTGSAQESPSALQASDSAAGKEAD